MEEYVAFGKWEQEKMLSEKLQVSSSPEEHRHSEGSGGGRGGGVAMAERDKTRFCKSVFHHHHALTENSLPLKIIRRRWEKEKVSRVKGSRKWGFFSI